MIPEKMHVRWQGTDNCLHDKESYCWHCDVEKWNTTFYITKSWECKGYEKKGMVKKKMTNTELLRKKIDDSGYKLVFIAEKCGLTYQGFLKKLKGESDFKAPEMAALRDLLNLHSDMMDEIFFGIVVDKTSTN